MNPDLSLSPDEVVFLEIGPVSLNATVVFTWVVMAVLVLGSWLITRNLSTTASVSRRQILLETLVTHFRRQIREMTRQNPDRYLPFLGTLFLYISLSNLLSIVPIFESPAGSLTTAAALAAMVFIAVPVFGVARRGLPAYLRSYTRPSIFMLPFNILSELSRTLALAVRLFGNVMSGSMIIGVLLSIAPFFVPVIMQVLELIIGQIQAYIFAALATIYIGSATRVEESPARKGETHG